MPRYIMIDSFSGWIYGDTADLPEHPDHHLMDDVRNSAHSDQAMVAAARWMDEATGNAHGRAYQAVSRLDGRHGYEVYRADIGGSDAVSVVWDGQDQDTIDAVIKHCEHVGGVLWTDDA